MSIKDNPLSSEPVDRNDTAYGTITPLKTHDNNPNIIIRLLWGLLFNCWTGVKQVAIFVAAVCGLIVFLGAIVCPPFFAMHAFDSGSPIWGAFWIVFMFTVWGFMLNQDK